MEPGAGVPAIVKQSAVYYRAYYLKNRAKIIERTTARNCALYPKNRDSVLERNKLYRQTNRTRLLAQKAARRDPKKDAAYARNNRARYAAAWRRYDARKKQAYPGWANDEKILAFYIESARLTESTGVRHEVDHVIPLDNPLVCGLHCEANLQILTKSANASKRNVWQPQ